jgi:hypothetical protein
MNRPVRLCRVHSRGNPDEQTATQSPLAPPPGSADCPMCQAEQNEHNPLRSLEGTRSTERISSIEPDALPPHLQAVWDEAQRARGVLTKQEEETAVKDMDDLRDYAVAYDHAEHGRDRRRAGEQLASAIRGENPRRRNRVRVGGPSWTR